MNDNNNDQEEPPKHDSVIAELDQLEALTLLMLNADMSAMAAESRKHLLALSYRIISAALDKANRRTPA